MEELRCNSCNGKEFIEENGRRICAYCGTTYIVTAASTTISMDSDVKRLLAKCRANPKKASTYANLILDIDPGNTEALRYL